MRRYSPPCRSPPRRGYGGRGSSPPRRGHGGRKGPNHGSLLVRNIPLDCRPEELRVPFERFGPVRDVYMPRDYYSGKPRGFAFVEFVDSYDAAEAQRSMNRRIFAGREITVVVAAESRKRPEEMRVRTRTREPSSHGGRSSGRSRSRSASLSRSPRRPSDSRSRYRSRSHSPAPRRRADYSTSPGRKQDERPRSPRGSTREEEGGKYNRRSYSPGFEDAAGRDGNGNNEYREKSDNEAEERRREWKSRARRASRSESGSRSG
ncbi:PREDICTED: serine/arginine-rich SC35-like splicing factor SCL30 isoform X2 [Tarenaya hassleriana]|uniref:serine/arginine-rich SC35-like splicing factor SCL30 isoform X2 n=1 Tax=Tarenaya hassleriana TaxID=28532 RepID=UPI00053C99AD|nr:PREDICTED: serine/arginine-rich SC35-like splicing factor SCL30 isoform X2 [Tarenaya hassleriana]